MHTCRRAIAYFRQDWRLILFVVLLVGVNFFMGLAMAWPIPVLLDLLFSPTERTDAVHMFFIRILPASAFGRIAATALISLALKFSFDITLLIGRTMLNSRIRYNGLARVRHDLYQKLQHLPLSFHRTRPQGDTIYRLATDTQGFWGIIDTFIGAAISYITVIVMAIVMLKISVPLALLALAVLPFLVLSNAYFTPRIKRRADVAKQAESDFTTTVQRSVSAIGLIQAFCRQATDFGNFRDSVAHWNDSNWRLDWATQLYALSVQTLFGIATALVVGYGGYLAYRDQFLHPVSNGATVGDLLAFLTYVAMLNEPINRITGFRAMVQNSVAACNRVLTVLDTPVTIADPPGAKPLPPKPRTLSLQNVSFTYPEIADATPVLHGIHATVTPGQFVAFVGPSGAGKSTLFSLLPRFYDPTEGSVRLDGHDIRTIPIADLRRHITSVQQDSPLFPGTVADNIAFARAESTREEIIAAAQAAGADEFIRALENGYDTPISENAANISGGQRQRLALARAILADSPILILDEPTSAQDPHHANAILETLHSLRGTRTILLVTHDLKLVEECDQIYVLQHGRLTESGTHAQLMAKEGLYYTLHNAEPAAEVAPSLHIAS
ncbi:MAG: ABC transporter ATP-binding protein [Phycisphaerae bacterium]